jgi:hypothetical protein
MGWKNGAKVNLNEGQCDSKDVLSWLSPEIRGWGLEKIVMNISSPHTAGYLFSALAAICFQKRAQFKMVYIYVCVCIYIYIHIYSIYAYSKIFCNLYYDVFFLRIKIIPKSLWFVFIYPHVLHKPFSPYYTLFKKRVNFCNIHLVPGLFRAILHTFDATCKTFMFIF